MAIAACSQNPIRVETRVESAVAPQVMTVYGPVHGMPAGDALAFLGIPYATPPVGPLRWRAPVTHAPWPTPLAATQLGSECPQGSSGAEDCLYLNIWTPSVAPASLRPVMVFIHGGGFAYGSGALSGQYLAEHRGVVVITFNYRLGQLGFLAHPSLIAEDTEHHSAGNYGLLDQQMALQWVQSNVASFGGDPNKVTIVGESAGSVSVCFHLVSPLSAGLFQRAIGESGSCSLYYTPLWDAANPSASAAGLGEKVAAALGCDTASDVAACLRSKSVADVIQTMAAKYALKAGPSFSPNVDGWVLPMVPWLALQSGNFAHVPTLTGTNENEGSGLAILSPVWTWQDFFNVVSSLFPQHASDLDWRYLFGGYPSPQAAYSAFLTDALFICPARAQARAMAAVGAPTYLYHFSYVNVAGLVSGIGAYHTEELDYLFGNWEPAFGVIPVRPTPLDLQIRDLVQGYWTNFMATGDPNGGGSPRWPEYTAANDTDLTIGYTTMTATSLRKPVCDAFASWSLP